MMKSNAVQMPCMVVDEQITLVIAWNKIQYKACVIYYIIIVLFTHTHTQPDNNV